ncbi:MAG: hypothetical protein J6X03_00250 [Bacilli bacterium]|nr:hypothetical protein [Bacilli bacterium]
MNNLEEFDYYNRLVDLYKDLLTDIQKNIVVNYYLYNLSLSELSEELKITRSAVSYNLELAKKNLKNYEEKLHLLKKYSDLADFLDKKGVNPELKDEILEELI